MLRCENSPLFSRQGTRFLVFLGLIASFACGDGESRVDNTVTDAGSGIGCEPGTCDQACVSIGREAGVCRGGECVCISGSGDPGDPDLQDANSLVDVDVWDSYDERGISDVAADISDTSATDLLEEGIDSGSNEDSSWADQSAIDTKDHDGTDAGLQDGMNDVGAEMPADRSGWTDTDTSLDGHGDGLDVGELSELDGEDDLPDAFLYHVPGSDEGEPIGGGGEAVNLVPGLCVQLPMSPYQITGYHHGSVVRPGILHGGDDISASAGDPVFAVYEGIVLTARRITTWGTLIEIEHTAPDGTHFYSIHGHLREPGRAVSEGNRVSTGDLLGYIGTREQNGGWPEHLHFSIFDGTYPAAGVLKGHIPEDEFGDYQDPVPFLEAHGAGAGCGCLANDHQDCWENNSYWHDSCGNRGEIADRCVDGEVCVDTGDVATCVCLDNDHQACFVGDVYWYDSCGALGDRAHDCTGGEECVDLGDEAVCRCISNDHQDCYSGDVYWYDSCGNRGIRIQDCGSDEECIDLGETATCECECDSGVCCDGCAFRDSDYPCDTDTASDYGCPWGVGCGDDVGVRYRDRYCSGSSSSCNGSLGSWKSWSVADSCGSTETCSDGDSTCNYNTSCSELCNGVDDDGDGTIDELESCWVPVYRFWNTAQPESARARCYANTTTAPSNCAGYPLEFDGPVFYLYASQQPGTVGLVALDAVGFTHILTRSDNPGDIATLEGAGFENRGTIGYVWASTSSAPPGTFYRPAAAGSNLVRNLRRYSHPTAGVHLYANNPEETAPGWNSEGVRGHVWSSRW